MSRQLVGIFSFLCELITRDDGDEDSTRGWIQELVVLPGTRRQTRARVAHGVGDPGYMVRVVYPK